MKSQLTVEDKRKKEGFVPVAPNETLPPSGDSHTQVQGRPGQCTEQDQVAENSAAVVSTVHGAVGVPQCHKACINLK